MGHVVMILGQSGSGKSASLRNLKKTECVVLNVGGKLLPFKNDLVSVNLRNNKYNERYKLIADCISKYQDKVKTFIVDDSQFLMAFEMFDRSLERGYDKYTEIAKKWVDLCDFIAKTNDDVIVYFLHYNDYDPNSGTYKAKTVGKMIEQYISPESICTIVLGARIIDERYVFTTKSNGADTIKTPIGMFEKVEIDNDLKAVDAAIREYYGLEKKK